MYIKAVIKNSEIYLVFGKKFIVQRPRSVSDTFINVSAMSNAVVAIILVHDGLALVGTCQSITANTDQLKIKQI